MDVDDRLVLCSRDSVVVGAKARIANAAHKKFVWRQRTITIDSFVRNVSQRFVRMHLLHLLFFFAPCFQIAAFTSPFLITKTTLRHSKYPKHPAQRLSNVLFFKPSDEEDTVSVNIITGTLVVTSLSASSGVLWSEWAVYQTGCGPLNLPDFLERSCYLGVFLVSGLSVFSRIVFRQGLSAWSDPATKRAIQTCEILAWLAVVGAVVVLGNQMINGEAMDGLSGIDLGKCRAKQEFVRQIVQ